MFRPLDAAWTFACLSFLLILSGLTVSTSAFAEKVTIKGGLPRNLNTSSFSFTARVSRIDVDDYDAAKGNEDYRDWFRITLPDYDNEPLAFSNAGDIDFYVSEADERERDMGDETNGVLEYEFTIEEAGDETLEELVGNDGELKVKVEFDFDIEENANNPAGESEDTLTQQVFVIAEAPKFPDPAAAGSHKQITIFYKSQQKVDVFDKEGKKQTDAKEPAAVSAFVVRADINEKSLPARTFKPGQESGDPKASCTYSRPADRGGACISCDQNRSYLLANQVGDIKGIKRASGNPTAGSVTVGGLKNDKQYFVFLQYEPGGVKQSQCMPASPTRNFTLTELNGEGEAEVVDLRCFIATAAYGTALHEDLRRFRLFRDEVLAALPFGDHLIQLYYDYSPPAARFIARHPALKNAVRWVLEGPAALIGWAERWGLIDGRQAG